MLKRLLGETPATTWKVPKGCSVMPITGNQVNGPYKIKDASDDVAVDFNSNFVGGDVLVPRGMYEDGRIAIRNNSIDGEIVLYDPEEESEE